MADNIQHGIDNNPSGDAEKGAAIGGLGGAAVGAAAGSLAGPLGTLVGAVAGGLMGAGASGLAVDAVDQVDNHNTVSGVSHGTVRGTNPDIRASSDAPVTGTDVLGHNVVTGGSATTEAGNTGLAGGALVGGAVGAAVGGPVGAVVGGTLGSLSGGVAGDAAEAGDVAAVNNYSGDAFRAGAVSGENPVLSSTPMTDYRGVDTGLTSVGSTDQNADMASLGGLSVPGVRVGDDVPGQQTGGVESGPANSRGVMDKTVEAGHGDDRDDKVGGINLNDPAGPPELDAASVNPATGLTAAAYPGKPDGSRGVAEKIADAVTGHNK